MQAKGDNRPQLVDLCKIVTQICESPQPRGRTSCHLWDVSDLDITFYFMFKKKRGANDQILAQIWASQHGTIPD